MRVIIVDDEPLSRTRLRSLLKDHDDVQVVADCEDADEAIRVIRVEKPELVFLDVQMPGFDGFQVLECLEVTPAPAIIFVTAHAQHAVRAFEAAAVDYLLKPFDEQRLGKALDRARAMLAAGRAEELSAEVRRLIDRLEGGGTGYLTRVAVSLGRRTVFVKVEEIDWIEASGNYLRLHVGPSYHLIRAPIGQFEKQLDPARFARIHRSAIVQLDRVEELRLQDNGEYRVIVRGGVELPMSRGYRDRLPRG